MKVWILAVPGNEIVGVFSSLEKAQKYISEHVEIFMLWEGWAVIEPKEFEVQ